MEKRLMIELLTEKNSILINEIFVSNDNKPIVPEVQFTFNKDDSKMTDDTEFFILTHEDFEQFIDELIAYRDLLREKYNKG